MKHTRLHTVVTWLIAIAALACVPNKAQAQPRLVSSVPANNASGVSTTAAVVFTFSEEMDTTATSAMFVDPLNFANPIIPVSESWNSGFTVLTCTPIGSFPASKMIYWTIDGSSLFGDPLDTASGMFTTSSGGGGGGGSGTNQFTTFAVGKVHHYHQTNDVLSLDPDFAYSFAALTSLASNRTATAISVTLPTSTTQSLTNWIFGPAEDYQFFDYTTNLTAFETTYPSGNYVFTITSTPASTPATANLPGTMQQPNAPKISNWTALQSANPTQAVTISWSAFQGGTVADYIKVMVGNAFETPDVGASGALNGTQTSVTIPANTLQDNTGYDASIWFYRAAITTNAAKAEVTEAYRATVTDFTVQTSTGGGGLGNPVQFADSSIIGGKFTCEINCEIQKPFVIESSPTMLPGSWQPVFSTNPVGTKVQFIDTRPLTDRQFYRARNGT